MKLLHTFILLAIASTGSLAMSGEAAKRREYGFVGYGISPFQPTCAFACRDAISGATLNCSTVEDMPGMDGMAMEGGMVMTDLECYATDDSFLRTLAYCVMQRCKGIPSWELERFWKDNVAGAFVVQPDPKETYQEALASINGTPIAVYSATGPLNQTSVVSDDLWFASYNTDVIFVHQENMQERYGLVVLLSGVFIPIGCSLLRFIPMPGIWRSKFNALFIDPPVLGARHGSYARYGLDQGLTRGQAFFIFYLIVINVVLSAVNYEWADPNTWYPDNRWRWMVMLVSNRLGLLSFANLPLVFLYAGRNNFLLWLTNWSHSTFILLHRWIAAIATLQAILHSLIYLHAYVKQGTHATESKLPYWYWGIIGTLGMAILFPTSISPIRKKAYELFLAWHVAISILIIVGCYWHIVFEFQHSWGYELWIIIAMVIWAFDRIARWLRLARNGVHTAEISNIDDEYIRIIVPGVTGGGFAYLYFLTLTWRFWENHPFSVASSILLPTTQPKSEEDSNLSRDIEKSPETTSSPVYGWANKQMSPSSLHEQPARAGITFYVRDRGGATSTLRNHKLLPVLVEAGYSSHSISSMNKSPILVALVGGVGITAVLPCLRAHPGCVKLYWACRSQALVTDVRNTGALAHVNQEIYVGSRMNIRDILERESQYSGISEVAVLTCGPEGLMNEARNAISSIVRRGNGVNMKLYTESFG